MKIYQWYEKFNTKVYVFNTIVVTMQHEYLIEWTSQQVNNNEFSALQDAEQETIRADTEESYLTYIFSNKAQRQAIN